MDTRVQFKIGISFFILFGIWQLLQSQAVSDAFLQFIAAGALPGTTKTLSPTGVFWLLGVFLAVSVAAIFHGELWRMLRCMFRSRPKQAPVAVAPTASEPAVVITIPGREGYAVQLARRARRWIAAILAQLPSGAQNGVYRIGQSIAALTSIIAIFLQTVWVLVGWVGRQLYRATAKSIRITGLLLVAGVVLAADLAERAWIWFEPYARQFDRWLERKLHQNQQTALFVRAIHEVAQTFHGWFVWMQTFKNENLSRPKLPDEQE
ncbi:MAG TPA: hypothetical protein VMY99_03690 [Nevskiaceae bacterium]|nr:hypothetical protein [Nevskiaceae bacterium]